MEVVTDFLFLGSKLTVDSDYRHEIRRWLLAGRKAMKNLDSELKRRDIILPTKVCIVKAMVFPVVMSWEGNGNPVQYSHLENLWMELPGGYSPWGGKESERTEWFSHTYMVFPVVTYGCESRIIKKAECQRIDAFELWYWRRLLKVPWTARRLNQ